MRIGFLGLGTVGEPVANNLRKAGHDLTVWNRTRSKADHIVSKGGKLAPAPKACAEGKDLVFTCLSDEKALEAVLGGPDGALAGLAKGDVLAKLHGGGREIARLDRVPESRRQSAPGGETADQDGGAAGAGGERRHEVARLTRHHCGHRHGSSLLSLARSRGRTDHDGHDLRPGLASSAGVGAAGIGEHAIGERPERDPDIIEEEAAKAKGGMRGIALQELDGDFRAYWPLRNKGTTAKCSPFLQWRARDYRRGIVHYPPKVARMPEPGVNSPPGLS